MNDTPKEIEPLPQTKPALTPETNPVKPILPEIIPKPEKTEPAPVLPEIQPLVKPDIINP
ncbi:MAG: hypothetical protein K0S33_787 [Bacteroidetes bacterium]|jgi:hypothetical protein|nr:hypothetical protein [Bacteroidota bacterium]